MQFFELMLVFWCQVSCAVVVVRNGIGKNKWTLLCSRNDRNVLATWLRDAGYLDWSEKLKLQMIGGVAGILNWSRRLNCTIPSLYASYLKG